MSLCDQCCQELPQYIADDEPALARYQVLRAHLQACDRCRAYALRLRVVEDALRTYPAVSPEPGMTLLVMRRVVAQDRRGEEEWHLLPWDVSVPAMALVLALGLLIVSMPPQPSPAVPVQELERAFFELPSTIDAWLTPVRALMSKDIFWAAWSGVFATTAGLGIGLSLANWNALNREGLDRLGDRIAHVVTWVFGSTRRAG
jgi:anti-sigma factor RsiW